MYELTDVFDFIRTLAAMAVPLVVAILGKKFSERLKAIDQHFWFSQKVIEKRLSVYDGLAEKLNKLFCYFTYVGDWKLYSPREIVDIKRELDRTMHTHRYIFPEEVFATYQSFMHTLFLMYTGAGEDAKLRTRVFGSDGDRERAYFQTHGDDATDFSLDYFFEENASSKADVRERYALMMSALAESLGIHQRPRL